MILRFAAILLLSAVLLLSCKREKKTEPAARFKPGERYFSLYQFAQDQWEYNFRGRPLVFQRMEERDGRTDSSYVALDTLHWSEITSRFFAADISDPKFLGRYRYSQFDEPRLSTKTLQYEAMEDDLFTRSMQINVDGYSSKVQSVLIRTRGADKEQVLLYAPGRIIQMQELGRQAADKARNLRIEYRLDGEGSEPGVMM